MTGDNTINVLLETFQQCRQRGDWATLSLETRNGDEYATFQLKLPAPRATGTPGTPFSGSRSAKKKSPSRVRRDRQRIETFKKKQSLQQSWNPKTPVTPSIKFQAWNSPALDKEENATSSETTNDDVPIITSDKTDESEVSQEDVKGKGMFTIDSENREAWMAKFKEQCEKAASIGCKEVGTEVKKAMEEISVGTVVKKAMEEIQTENGTEEILDNEENDSFEDVKKWAVNQKQSITSD